MRQTAHALTRTSSCPLSGFGFGTARNCRGCFGRSRTIARIALNIALTRALSHGSCSFKPLKIVELASAGRGGPYFSLRMPLPRFWLVMVMGAAEKRHFVEHVFLEPLKPQIDNGCDK